MQVKVESVKDLTTNDRGTSAKMIAGGNTYYVNQDPTNLIGKEVEIEVTEKTSAKGNKYKIANILRVIEASTGSGNGRISWEDYQQMASNAHGLALNLEPDSEGLGGVTVDRSQARAAIVNTAMIAFANGKISPLNSEPDDEVPF